MCVCVSVCVCMYVYVCIYKYINIYMYICMYVHIGKGEAEEEAYPAPQVFRTSPTSPRPPPEQPRAQTRIPKRQNRSRTLRIKGCIFRIFCGNNLGDARNAIEDRREEVGVLVEAGVCAGRDKCASMCKC